MRCCIRLSYSAVFLCLLSATLAAGAQSSSGDDPDALYRDREHAASATAAERIWAARLAANPKDFETAWKLARARYWLGTNGPGSDGEKKALLERGIEAARLATDANATAADGPFWTAACMGALAESHGLRQGLKYRGQIRASLETARRLDPAFLYGSPDRALGRWYYKVPGLFGGDLEKSERHLRAALAYKGDSIISLLFLGDTLEERGRKDEARRTFEAALAAPLDPEWAPEDTRFKAQARARLRALSR